MALPKLNSTLLYKTTVPSTGETVEFRPFLVGEEKLFLIASQSTSPRVLFDTIKRVVRQCVITPSFDVDVLKSYDLEYMFLQLRAKSVGEQENLSLLCGQCDTKNTYQIDFEQNVYVSEYTGSDMIDLGGGVSLRLALPEVDQVIGVQETHTDESAMAFAMIDKVIDKVFTQEEALNFADESPADREAFVQSMTSGQLQLILEFLSNAPQVSMDVSFECGECGAKNEIVLKGIADFFE